MRCIWSRPDKMTRSRIIGGISALIALVLWETIARLNAESFVIAGPIAVLVYLSDNAGLVARATVATLSAAVWGFLWGNLAAISMAIIVFMIPRSQRVISALALVIFCLPLVATGPILRVLYGPGEGPQITLAALAVYYTTFLAILIGMRAIPQSWSDLNRIYGRGRWSDLIHIRGMASLPYLIAGLKIAAPAAFLGAMIGEFTGAERGLGVLTLRAMQGLNVEATWALAVVSSAVAIFAYGALGWVGWRLGYAPAMLLSPQAEIGERQSAMLWLLDTIIITALLLGLWHLLMDIFDLNPFFAKRPGDVWVYLIEADTSATSRAALFNALKQTLSLAIPGYLAGLVLGATLAALLMLAPILAATVLPLAVALRSIPIITTAPLIVLALGRGATGTITIVAVMIFFPTLVACLQGLRQAPGQIIDVFDSYAAGRLRLLMWARIPAMLPAFFAAARMAVPAAVLAVTTTEWLATGKGIGNLMALTATTSNYNMLWSAIVVLSAVSVAGYAAITAIERAVLRVYASEQVPT
jgi:sulfonate transport system permease protein